MVDVVFLSKLQAKQFDEPKVINKGDIRADIEQFLVKFREIFEKNRLRNLKVLSISIKFS